jgi:hypothetical protein
VESEAVLAMPPESDPAHREKRATGIEEESRQRRQRLDRQHLRAEDGNVRGRGKNTPPHQVSSGPPKRPGRRETSKVLGLDERHLIEYTPDEKSVTMNRVEAGYECTLTSVGKQRRIGRILIVGFETLQGGSTVTT